MEREGLTMLDSLDTLIGFALIFTVVSLLITILVQIVTSVLNLRGHNLAWGIAEAFEVIAPDLKARARGDGKALADHLLKDYLISDSQLGFWRGKASAVRPGELFALLHSIAVGKRAADQSEIRNHVKTLFKGLGVPECVFEMTDAEKARLGSLKAEITAELATLPAGNSKDCLQAKLESIEIWLKNTESTLEAVAIRWAGQGEAEIQRIYQKFEHWFETGQERSQEWFTTHARIITGLLGLVAAFLLQLDAVEIYSLVSSNRELRANLVAQVKPVIEQGEKILKESPTVMQESLRSLGTFTNAAVGINASNTLLGNIPVAATDTPGAVRGKISDAYTGMPLKSLAAALSDVPEHEGAVGHDEYVKKLNDRFSRWHGELSPELGRAIPATNFIAKTETGKSNYMARIASALEKERDAVLTEFESATLRTVQARVGVSGTNWNNLKHSLDNTGFDLFPKGGWRWEHKGGDGWSIWWENFIDAAWSSHTLGMFYSALLLSLGAPFWFNALKSLASLRSSVAKNISNEDKAELKNAESNQGGKAPVTATH